MNDLTALQRLNALLPLKQRQDSLPLQLKLLHQQILRALVFESTASIANLFADLLNDIDHMKDALQTLAKQDLIVLNQSGEAVVGAYPVTTEPTPHKVMINDRAIYAMCALDAVSISPMFDTNVAIYSVCHVTGEPIAIQHEAGDSLCAQPSDDVMVGIRWQKPQGCAAHSLCTEMVFLKDRATAENWQNGDTENISLLTLDNAVSVGKAFFVPLLQDCQNR